MENKDEKPITDHDNFPSEKSSEGEVTFEVMQAFAMAKGESIGYMRGYRDATREMLTGIATVGMIVGLMVYLTTRKIE